MVKSINMPIKRRRNVCNFGGSIIKETISFHFLNFVSDKFRKVNWLMGSDIPTRWIDSKGYNSGDVGGSEILGSGGEK